MRRLLAIALLWPLSALAQITWTATPGSGYQPLDGATVRGSISVRTDNAAPPVTYVLDGVAQNTENGVPIDLYGDLGVWDTTRVTDGQHVIRAGTHTATFTVSNGAPTPPTGPTWTGSSVLTWVPPTTNSDGTPLTDLAGYLIDYGNAPGALTWRVRLPNPGLTTYTLTGLAPGRYYLGIRAFNATGAESDLSSLVEFQIVDSTPACPPKPPDETQTQACVAPAVGSWMQTRTYAQAAYPTCWTASAWLPASAPAGACAVPPPPVTWRVKPISGNTRPVYELVRSQGDTSWVRGYKLGDIDTLKPCEAEMLYRSSSTTEYHRVAEGDVILLSPTYRGRTLIAVCSR
jgi:hypothetical protein